MKLFSMPLLTLVGWIGICFTPLAVRAQDAPLRQEALRPVAITDFFVIPGQPATLRWQAATPKAPDPRTESAPTTHPESIIFRDSFTITNYEGDTIQSGSLAGRPDGSVELTVTLAPGFYELNLKDNRLSFGIMAINPCAGQPDPFFCIDAGLTWLVPEEAGPQATGELIRILKRSGIAMSRERFSLGTLRPESARWNEAELAAYSKVRETYTAEGVPILEMSHDAPFWMCLEDVSPKQDNLEKLIAQYQRNRYPRKLVDYAQIMGELAKRGKGSWQTLEAWNEPDIKFGSFLPPDQYVPVVKALANMLDQVNPTMPLVGGVFTGNQNAQYMEGCARNGLLDVINALSFHFYGPAAAMEEMIRKHRIWLEANAKHGMDLWITECGKPWTKGLVRPPRDQAAASALDLTMKAIESRAGGVARFFAFVYPFYDEGNNNYGMMGRELTPTALMAAYTDCLARLTGTRYLGDLKHDDPAIRRARVFGRETDSAIIVLYTGEPRKGASVMIDVSARAVHGIDGRLLAPGANGAIPIPDGLAYVMIDAATLMGRLITDTPAMMLNRLDQPAYSRRAPANPIILQPLVDLDKVQAQPAGYRLPIVSKSRMRLGVRVHNLSPDAHPVEIRALWLGDGNTQTEPQSLNIEPVPVAGEPNSSTDVWLDLDLSKKLSFEKMRWLEVRAESTSGGTGPVSRMNLPLILEPTLADLTQLFRTTDRLHLGPVENWKHVMPASGRMEVAVTTEGLQLTVHFDEGDRWAYPRFKLPATLDLSRYDGIVARVRSESPASPRMILFEQSPKGEYGYYTAEAIASGDGQWHAVYIPFASLDKLSAMSEAEGSLDLDKVHEISFGLNSDTPSNVLHVSDVTLVGDHKPAP